MIRKIITILCISFLAFSHSVLNASASITAKQYHQNGSILKTIDKTVKLTCSPTGSLS